MNFEALQIGIPKTYPGFSYSQGVHFRQGFVGVGF